ncbi:phosphoribosylformylglycinamidine synthase II, partial [Candidatus Desantisbacteria bacterium]|nr:phosphoribosylformylglycinamidine synthase II [Candidatus Desantisbacteria bacterium]
IGGSEYLKVIHGMVKGSLPVIDLNVEVRVQQVVLKAFEAGIIKSAHDCAEGGLAVTLAECCIQGKTGARIECKPSIPIMSLLFGESGSRIIVSMAKDNLGQLMQIITQADIPYEVLGVVGGEALIINDLIRLSLEEMEANYQWQN